ncbi:MAG: glycosyltransferase family 39 protein [Chloroflexi bacterium]|nr:glycosyltransferase family 39 protein [Chloroflexota bacterium]
MTDQCSPCSRPATWSATQIAGLVGILLLAASARFYLLGDQSLWYDESDRVFIASLPVWEIFPTMAEEGLHYLPLYFLVQKPFVEPFSETAARFPSACFGILAVVLMAQVGREFWGRRAGLMSALLLALNPFHVWFSRDASFYALVALSSLGTLYFFLRLLRAQRTWLWVGLTLFTGLGICTHYFAFVMPVVQLVYLAITLRRNHPMLRPWLLSQVGAFLPLVPWYVFVTLRREFYFGSAALVPPTPIEVVYTLWNFSIGYTGDLTLPVVLSLIVFWSMLALGLVSLFRRRPDLGSLLVLWFAFPVAMTYLMALRLPMYVDRYLMPTFPAFVLIVVAGLVALGRRWGTLGLVALVAASALGTVRIYCDPAYDKEDWRGVAQYIKQHEQPNDLVMPLLYQSLTPLLGQYYHGQAPIEPVLIGDQGRDPETLVANHRRVWLIIPQHQNSTHLLARCQPFDTLNPVNYTSPFERAIRPWLEIHLSELVWHHDFVCISVLLFDLSATGEGP